MLDIGFSELLVIGSVALIVIGPERLPKVARTVGTLLGRAQRYVNDVKSDINRQMELDELRKLQTQMNDAAREVESSISSGMAGVQGELEGINQSVNDGWNGSASAQGGSSNESSSDPYRSYAEEAHARRVRQKVQDRLRERRKKPRRESAS